MATFTYSVRSTGDQASIGTLNAESRVDALNLLRARGLFVIDLAEQEANVDIRSGGFGGGFFQQVKLMELAIFFRQLAAMVGAGIALTRSLNTLAKQTKNVYFAKLLEKIKNDISSGMSFSSALAKFPRVFNSLVISLMLAAEETGTMDSALDQLARTFEAEVNLRSQISAGMRYPQIVATAALMIVTFVMIFVVPQFNEIFVTLQAKLPFTTQVVMNLALFMKRFWWLIIALYLGIPWGLSFINQLPGGRDVLDQLKLMIPVFGELNRKIIMARMSRVFSTMLTSGVPILKALTIVEQTMLNAVYEKSMAKIRNAVKEGRSIGGPMEGYSNLYPPMVTAMVAVGEESGTLDTMLLKINDFYTMEVEATVKKLTALIEPVLIVVLGSIIGFIVIALWMPLFKVIQLIQQLD